MKPRHLLFPLVAAALVASAGCGDDPFRIDWEDNRLEAVLFSLDREELNRPSAFSMRQRRTVVVESAGADGRWDFVVDRAAGELALLPPRALGVESRAGIVAFPGVEWEDVREAPRDSLAYTVDELVPLQLGTIYVVRTHQQSDPFGRQCVFYGKVEPVEVDDEAGVLRFLHDTNPACNDRDLVPTGG